MSEKLRPKIRVLTADDSIEIRETLFSFLTKQDQLVVMAQAADGQEALEQAGRLPVDLAILDIQMPKMSGLEAAAELRKRFPHLRILLMSAYAEPEMLRAAKKSGANGFIVKGRLRSELMRKIRRLFPEYFPQRLAKKSRPGPQD
ncbi:MAG TPA: response regulator transcription factor [Bryobacterales bacterium]|nr:response regulator transcription factor [Bryobacterales bacterium]